MNYYSKSKNELIPIADMVLSHRANAALKAFRNALLTIVNTKLHYSALSSIEDLTWEDVEQYLQPLSEFIQDKYPDVIDSDLEAFIEYMNTSLIKA